MEIFAHKHNLFLHLVMPHNRYRELPLDTLYELIVKVVGELLHAADTQSSEFKSSLKELNLVYEAINERLKKTSNK